jgi:ribosome biogenesis protein Nip4
VIHITDGQRAELAAAVDAWQPGFLDQIEDRWSLAIICETSEDRIKWAVTSPEAAQDLERPQDGTIASAGLPMGDVRRGRWKPTLDAARLLARAGCRRRVRVASELVQPFLYGRRLDNPKLLGSTGEWSDGDTVLIEAPNGDMLGLAKLVIPHEVRVTRLEPVHDLGWYLREGG